MGRSFHGSANVQGSRRVHERAQRGSGTALFDGSIHGRLRHLGLRLQVPREICGFGTRLRRSHVPTRLSGAANGIRHPEPPTILTARPPERLRAFPSGRFMAKRITPSRSASRASSAKRSKAPAATLNIRSILALAIIPGTVPTTKKLSFLGCSRRKRSSKRASRAVVLSLTCNFGCTTL